MSRAQKLLTIIAVIGLLAALYAAALRWRVEMANRRIALILDWKDAQALASASGVTTGQALDRLRAAGATGVAISEEHLPDLVAAGRVTVFSTEAAGLGPLSPDEIVLSALDAATADRLRTYLAAKLGPGDVLPTPRGTSPLLIPVRAAPNFLEKVGLGWPDEAPGIVSDAGLTPAARIDNYPGLPKSAITFMAAQAAAADANLVIFSGDQVLGYPGLIEDTAQALQAAHLTYGSLELVKQLGDDRLGYALDGDLVRVHAITEKEIVAMQPAVAIARYTRAVRERGVRACYVRLFLTPRDDALAFNEDYLRALAGELTAAGYNPGAPAALAQVAIGRPVLIAMAAGTVAAAVVTLAAIVPIPAWLAYLLWIVGAAIGAGLLVAAPHFGRAEKALLAAVVFPSLALILVARAAQRGRGARSLSSAGVIARAVAWLIGDTVISVIGGILVAGLLTERLYMTQVLQFLGVKVALAAPVVVVGAVWIFGLYAENDWAAYARRVQENLRRVWNQPLYVWEAVLAVALAGAAALMLVRSGNQPGVEVSSLELRVRGLLEQVFFARPRTKEFLIGHPALMLAVAMALRRRRRWLLLLLLLGAMGQASVVNTYCHLHTPIFFSLLRSAHGLWVGIAIGAAVVWIWERLRGADPAEREAQG
jgi:hypothetical protein